MPRYRRTLRVHGSIWSGTAPCGSPSSVAETGFGKSFEKIERDPLSSGTWHWKTACAVAEGDVASTTTGLMNHHQTLRCAALRLGHVSQSDPAQTPELDPGNLLPRTFWRRSTVVVGEECSELLI